MQKPFADPSNRNIDFAALTGRKADLTKPSKAIKSSARKNRRVKRPHQYLSESEEPSQPTETLDGAQTGTGGEVASHKPFHSRQSASPNPKSSLLTSSAELGMKSKRARLSQSVRSREMFQQDAEAFESRHPRNLKPTLKSSKGPTPPPDMNTIIVSDDSDNGETQGRKTTQAHTSTNTNIAPRPLTQNVHTRIKNEPLSPEITARIKLRVKADGPGISARGPVLVNFEIYKTSERLFTSLMSERSLKPEMQKRVSQLTATVRGKEICCRRDRLDDWMEVCGEVRRSWDGSPELFDERFEVDVMLHVDDEVRFGSMGLR